MDATVNKSGSAAPHKYYGSGSPALCAHPSSRYSSGDFVKEPAEYYSKYRIYERDYLRCINHKYFSVKKIAGTGRVFETITSVDGFIIKESSEPPIKRFLDLPSSKEEQHSRGSGEQPPHAKKPPRRKG